MPKRLLPLAALFALVLGLFPLLFAGPLRAGGPSLDLTTFARLDPASSASVDAWASLQPSKAKAAPVTVLPPPSPVPQPVQVTVAAAAPTVVTLSWGEWVMREVFPWVWVTFTAIFAFAARRLPGWAYLLLKTYGEQKLLGQLHDIAQNAVAGATKNGTATYQLDVGSRVLATGVQAGVDLYPWAMKLLGGPDAVRIKLLGMMNIDPEISADAIIAASKAPAAAPASV